MKVKYTIFHLSSRVLLTVEPTLPGDAFGDWLILNFLFRLISSLVDYGIADQLSDKSLKAGNA